MKKILSFVLALVTALSLVGCGKTQPKETTADTTASSAVTTLPVITENQSPQAEPEQTAATPEETVLPTQPSEPALEETIPQTTPAPQLPAPEDEPPIETQPAEPEVPPKQPPSVTAPQASIDALDNKKVIFIGNSYTQNGFAVMWKNINVLTQAERSNDRGFFYQLCKAKGMEVSVTNWCFGGHSISHTFGGPCTQGGACKGEDHASYLEDRYYDYVVFQCYKEKSYNGDLLSVVEPMMTLFRQANPNVKFSILVPHMAYEKNDPYVRDLESLKSAQVTICNWGKLVYDICSGAVQVPNATLEHTRSSYVVSVSESDGYHENMLAGYLTALFTYCAITGESALDQSYDFCNDPTIHAKFSTKLHRKQYYTYDPNTNFDAILASPEDMNGLQQLVDEYLKLYN